MAIYYAPLEGFTDAVYRRAHHAAFGGVQKYYIPFISPTQNLCFTPKEKAAVLPENNAGVPTVPQVLANDADQFLWAANALHDMGYEEINLNTGCPSGTVTAKYKGSGMLRDLDSLKRFLDTAFAKVPCPLSIKTRIGFTSYEEWDAILELYAQYPIYELTVHPRTRVMQYSGVPIYEAFEEAAKRLNVPLVYNGDLFTAEDCAAFALKHPGVPMMLGRGLLTNPALARQVAGGAAFTVDEIRNFHDLLMEGYTAIHPWNVAQRRLCDAVKYMSLCFADSFRVYKNLRKAPTQEAYLTLLNKLFDEHELLPEPKFLPNA